MVDVAVAVAFQTVVVAVVVAVVSQTVVEVVDVAVIAEDVAVGVVEDVVDLLRAIQVVSLSFQETK